MHAETQQNKHRTVMFFLSHSSSAWKAADANELDDGPLPTTLTWKDVLPEESFFTKGLADNGSMVFGPGVLQDRALLRKILLNGASQLKPGKLVDLYHVVQFEGTGKDKRRKKVRPTIAKAALCHGCRKLN